MVDTIKFSEMTDGGDLNNDDKVPGLLGGENVLFNNAWVFLPPGTTAQRPTPSSVINYRLRFNTDDQLYEYYDAVLGAWTQLQETLFTNGPYIIYTADASFPDAQNLGALADGILIQTIAAGVATIDILALPLMSPYGGTGVASPTIHTLPVAQGASNFNFLGPLTNGQLLIGSTGTDPIPAALIAGTNISIVNAPGSITISATGLGGFSWNVITGTSQAMLPNNGYITDNSGLVTLTLPLTSAVGDEIDIIGKGSGGWLIAQNSGQSIVVGNESTTVGAGGSLASTDAKDSFYMICTVADTEWQVGAGVQGNITYV